MKTILSMVLVNLELLDVNAHGVTFSGTALICWASGEAEDLPQGGGPFLRRGLAQLAQDSGSFSRLRPLLKGLRPDAKDLA